MKNVKFILLFFLVLFVCGCSYNSRVKITSITSYSKNSGNSYIAKKTNDGIYYFKSSPEDVFIKYESDANYGSYKLSIRGVDYDSIILLNEFNQCQKYNKNNTAEVDLSKLKSADYNKFQYYNVSIYFYSDSNCTEEKGESDNVVFLSHEPVWRLIDNSHYNYVMNYKQKITLGSFDVNDYYIGKYFGVTIGEKIKYCKKINGPNTIDVKIDPIYTDVKDIYTSSNFLFEAGYEKRFFYSIYDDSSCSNIIYSAPEGDMVFVMREDDYLMAAARDLMGDAIPWVNPDKNCIKGLNISTDYNMYIPRKNVALCMAYGTVGANYKNSFEWLEKIILKFGNSGFNLKSKNNIKDDITSSFIAVVDSNNNILAVGLISPFDTSNIYSVSTKGTVKKYSASKWKSDYSGKKVVSLKDFNFSTKDGGYK